MEGRHGLTELYASSEEVVADIIFVHGLFGHPYKTWSSGKSRSKSPRFAVPSEVGLSPQVPQEHDLPERDSASPTQGAARLYIDNDGDRPSTKGYNMWPEMLLPAEIPNTRIFTWGYDADVNGLLSSASQNTIHDHANNLLSDLDDLRSSDKDITVPIIFVVHSLGGIVVKDALNRSSSEVGTRLKHIAPATFGIIFLGTPHRGSKSASIGKIANQISLVASKRPNLRLLQGLERKSEILDRIGDGFRQTILKHNISLYSFREEKETRRLGIFSTIVVDADSAKIGDGKEEIGSIPSDHSNMTKFKSHYDIGFRRVSAGLRRWIEIIKHGGGSYTKVYDDCLTSLDTSDARKRIYEVHDAHERTFNWIFDLDTVSFGDWLQTRDAPIYWIQGKPGSGKSTLMKFAMRDARTLDLLANASKTRWTIAAFFFHDRGSVIQKSLDGMVQEILHSILDQVPALLAFVTPIFLKISKSQRTNSPEWDIQALREAFLAITQQCRVRLQLCLFIDALDEHMGDNEQLVQLLKDIVTKRDSEFTKLKICIASRSWTVFTQHFGNCPGFAIHDYTATDISTYVESRLSIDHLGSQLSLNQEQLRKISNQVAGKAFGVFIWVRLVMDLVTDDIRDGTPFEAIEDRILSMPEELEDLYRHTVRRIEPKYLHEAYVMLQIAFCSVSPLHLSTFIAVTECNLDDQIRSYKNTLPNLTMDMRRLYSRGGGLLEAVHSPQDGEDVWYVQLIHQTVKHYMQNHQHELREATRFHGSGYIFLLRSVSLDHRRNLDIPAAVRPNGFINANLLQDPSTTLTKEEIAAVRPNVFIYAKLYEESSTTLPKEEIDLYVTLLREIAKFTIEDDILEWCSSNALLSTLVHDSSDDEPDVFGDDTWLFFCIAVAAGLNIYVDNEWEILSRIHSKYVRVCPLRIAATGLNIGRQSDVDNLSMMKSILSAGYDVDTKSRFVEHENIFDLDFYTHPSHFQYFSPLTALLVQQGINPTLGEEVSLQSARILLKAGADPNFLLPPFHRNLILTNDPRPKSVEMHLLEFLRFYTRSSTIPFVKLLVEHGAVFKIYPQSMTLVMVAVLGASHIAATPMGLPACNLFNIHPNRLKYLLQDYFL